MVQVLTLAFLVVSAGCVLMIPIMLYVLRLGTSGWTWEMACMFGAMVASTDAVAIIAIMRSSERRGRAAGPLLCARVRCRRPRQLTREFAVGPFRRPQGQQ